MTPAMHSRRNGLLARGTSAILLVIGALALVHSLGWRGARFPGFFVMPNRVVPSAALPGWSGVAEGRPLYQNNPVNASAWVGFLFPLACLSALLAVARAPGPGSVKSVTPRCALDVPTAVHMSKRVRGLAAFLARPLHISLAPH